MPVRLRRVGPGFNPVPAAIYELAKNLVMYVTLLSFSAFIITRDSWIQWLFFTQLPGYYLGGLAIHVSVDDLKQAIKARRMYVQ